MSDSVRPDGGSARSPYRVRKQQWCEDNDDCRQHQCNIETIVHSMRETRLVCVRVLDRIRPSGKGGTAQYGGVQASPHATPRGAPALRWRMQNNLDNNGMSPAGDVPQKPGIHAPTLRTPFSWCFAHFVAPWLPLLNTSPFSHLSVQRLSCTRARLTSTVNESKEAP